MYHQLSKLTTISVTCVIQGKSIAEDDDQVCWYNKILRKTEILRINDTKCLHLKTFNKEIFVRLS